MGASVVINGVSKQYVDMQGRQPFLALDNITLQVQPGEFLAVVGPSGCGKSTLLNIVAGLLPSTCGSVRIDDQIVQGRPSSKLGVVFQDYALFPWMTVQDNVEFGPRSRGADKATRTKRAGELIQLVGLTKFEHKYPHQLSGGMRQRCALARTLANDPELLLMDEPLTALDAQTRTILQGELLRIWGEHLPASQRRTVFFVTHNINEAVFLGDRIVVMSRRPGRIKDEIPNPLPRPRAGSQERPESIELVKRIWSLIERDALEAACTN
jgi:NitT/TauT family transport system ATP-binding protein